jgi:iron complex transport system substrate-binding protein
MPITQEALGAAAPDVILTFTSGLASVGGAEGLLAIPGVAQTEAGRNRAVLAFDGQYLLGYGPRTGAALAELIAAFAATDAAAVEAAPVMPATAIDASGAEVVIEDISRLVVLNGNMTEVVFALGLGDHVVGVDVSSTYPPEAQQLPRVGVQVELNAEGIIALGPTLVLGNTFAGPPEVIAQVRGAGIPVLILPDFDTLDTVEEKIVRIAGALGVPGRGAELAAAAVASIEEARVAAAGAERQPRVAFIYLRGPQVQMIGGLGSGATALIEAAGGIDVGVEVGVRGFMPITPEALVAAAPDVILTFTSGLASVGGVEGLLAIPGIAQTEAGRNRAVLAFDGQYLLGYGPRTGAALAELIAAIHMDSP